MSDRICKKCGKQFQYPCYLQQHLKRTKPCTLILEDDDLSEEEQKKKYKCCFCGRRFTTYTNMRRHVRERCKIAPTKKNGEASMELLYGHIIKKQQGQIEQQQKQIKQLLEFGLNMSEGKNSTSNITQLGKSAVVQGDNNVITQQTHNEQNNYTINIFGQETVDYINHATIYQIINKIQPHFELQEAAKAILADVLIQIYSDPDHPENYTCYNPNKKTGDTMIHGARGWELYSLQRATQPMIQKGLDVLFSNQPLPDKPGCGDMEPFDKFEKIYRSLANNETKYPKEMKESVRVVLLQIRNLLQKANGGKLLKAGDE